MLPLLFLLLLVVLPFGVAQTPDVGAVLQEFPECAQLCLATSVVQSSCGITDTTCICTNSALQLSIGKCVMQQCTVKEALTTKNASSILCDVPIRSRSETMYVVNITLISIIGPICLLRLLYSRFFSSHRHGWDDYLFILVVCIRVASVICIDRGAIVNGLGRDIWTLSFAQITQFVKWLYIIAILYIAEIALIKMSLLFFLLRIFQDSTAHRLLQATIFFIPMWAIAFLFATAFDCVPASNIWTAWDTPYASRNCRNPTPAVWAHSAINISIDLWMLAIPLYSVWHLHLTPTKKVNVIVMFVFGTFDTVISILRVPHLVAYTTSDNPSWEQFEILLWSHIELDVAILCACLPAIRGMLLRVYTAVRGTKSTTTVVSEQPEEGGEKKSSRGEKRGGGWSRPRKPGPDTILLATTVDEEITPIRSADFDPKNSHGGQDLELGSLRSSRGSNF